MWLRRLPVLALAVAIFCSLGASHRTTNFVVQAPTAEIAQSVGKWAEHYRKEKATQWLGYEMPTWPQPCPLLVTVNMEGPSGATSFSFHPQGGVMSQKMEIQGPLDRLIASVLPHEITHTVFAYYFRQPVPRWADEGGSVLSEDDLERERHNKLARDILNRSGQFPLRSLLSLKEYPPQRDKVMCLYAQGFSLAHYLVHISDRQTFLQFVAHGMRSGWDSAAVTVYKQRNVEALEEAWLKHLRETKGMTIIQLAQLKSGGGNAAQTTGGTVVRLTAPPAQPVGSSPVARGAAPTQEEEGQRFGQPGSYQPVPVQLGPPQWIAPATPGQVVAPGTPRQ